jgi:tetratricopeptide (TPR) repeat protein
MRLGTAVLLAVVCLGPRVQAQATSVEVALTKALDLEGANKCREAIPLYRQALASEDPVGAVLGLERCYAMVGRPDSLVAVLDSLLLRKPTDPTLRTVQLRTLSTIRRDDDLRVAFGQWTSLSPRDATPYRMYAQVLLEMGRARAADSVLTQAAEALGSRQELASEYAQMQSALGLWVPAARSWREAAESQSYLEQAAVFSLMPVPAALRDSVRQLFREAPVTLGARRVLSGLELKWHAPRTAWEVLSELPPGDSVVAAWLEFAQEAEASEAWLTARDAFARVSAARPKERRVAIRAATMALNGGDPTSALGMLDRVTAAGDSGMVATVTLLRVRALGALGRAREAQRELSDRASSLDVEAQKGANRALAWAWIRSGDLEKARASLEAGGPNTEEGERVAAWLALYAGAFADARRGLRRTDEPNNDVVTAMAFLSRTRVPASPAAGAAFLTLARGDTAAAARAFEVVANEVKDAAPFLFGLAARLYATRAVADTAHAVLLWQLLVESHADAPEAAEAELAWARVLRQRSDAAGALARLEHLILTWPQSALVPQARKEMDEVRGMVPRGSGEGVRSSVGGGSRGCEGSPCELK